MKFDDRKRNKQMQKEPDNEEYDIKKLLDRRAVATIYHAILMVIVPVRLFVYPAIHFPRENENNKDRHTVGPRMPEVDTSQDWMLLFGEENEFGTVLKFVRKINTCDDTEDEIITEGTSCMIFAYGERDPADESDISYHGTKRGTKSLALLSPTGVRESQSNEVRHYDFLNNNVLVPSDTTTYWCRGFKMPQIGKHHMIKFEAVVTPGNELNVHHILVLRCKVNSPDHWDGKAGLCYKPHRTLPACSNIIIVWVIGGEPFYFPDDIGFSVGGPEDDAFYIMETHFDNPTRKSNMIDNSGIRITMTSVLRKHEAAMLKLGHVIGYSQLVPPNRQKFVTKTYCSAECLNEGGFSTQEEMCLSFFYYYPSMKLEYYLSEPAYDAFGTDEQSLYHLLSTADWSNKTVADQLISTINKGNTHQACGGTLFRPPPPQIYKPAEPLFTYMPPPQDCT